MQSALVEKFKKKLLGECSTFFVWKLCIDSGDVWSI